MKSLDVVVLCKIFVLQSAGKTGWTYAELAEGSCLSVGETHASVRRLKASGLYDELTKMVIPSAMREFLIHGLKYAFPGEVGGLERGVATSHSAPVLEHEIVHGEADTYVWAFPKGQQRGFSVKPLGKNAPAAALRDRGLYDFLALIDALRIGKARERKIAAEKIETMIREMDKHGRT